MSRDCNIIGLAKEYKTKAKSGVYKYKHNFSPVGQEIGILSYSFGKNKKPSLWTAQDL
jgi:hypothetical protein